MKSENLFITASKMISETGKVIIELKLFFDKSKTEKVFSPGQDLPNDFMNVLNILRNKIKLTDAGILPYRIAWNRNREIVGQLTYGKKGCVLYEAFRRVEPDQADEDALWEAVKLIRKKDTPTIEP